MSEVHDFFENHAALSRRFFLRLGVAGSAAIGLSPLLSASASESIAKCPELAKAIVALGPFFTPPEDFQDVSRGKPLPHSIPEEKKKEVGLTRETWKLEVISDKENPAKLGKQFTKAEGTAIDFETLLKLGERRAVRFAKVMTCLNIGCPLGMGIWEGVPLREVVWLTKPREDVRRVVYYGYHNDDEGQMFKSSLPIGRVLEDPFDLPPVILCTKLNGEWLSPERGGPVRVVVPEHYGFKSIKWLSHIVLSNLGMANDTYIGGNNDVDSPLKSFAATLSYPKETPAGPSIPVTGYAQVGISGVSKVQVWLTKADAEWPADDKYFATAPWVDAEILSPPEHWGGKLAGDRIPKDTIGFDNGGKPKTWPMRLAKVHWAALLPGVSVGEYTLRCRTLDEKGIAQPLPRPFRKSGHAAIEEVAIRVK
jgi:DMSO/TMAO reductase YedYZ molybdopterin-dependent catalytic subunit